MRISDWSSDVCSSDLTKIINGQEQEVAIDSIHPGDLLRVKPGEKIPVDGSIREGEAVIDESMISGEPVPVEKTAGDKVSSGTIDRKSTRLNSSTNAHLVCRLLLEKKNKKTNMQYKKIFTHIQST